MPRILPLCLGLVLAALVFTGCRTTPSSGVRYLVRVEAGDTLAAIASKYDTTWQHIAAINNLRSPSDLPVGMILKIEPGPKAYIPHSQVARVHHPHNATPPPAIEPAQAKLRWPLSGKLSSLFGPRGSSFHYGIDIRAPRGTKFYSAHRGRITFVGWKNGYGKTIVVSHPDGSATLYAHAKNILVNNKTWVDRGDLIGRVGTTGNTTGPHLHFEYKPTRHAKGIDPMPFLRDARGTIARSH